jgi:hypothetical protein
MSACMPIGIDVHVALTAPDPSTLVSERRSGSQQQVAGAAVGSLGASERSSCGTHMSCTCRSVRHSRLRPRDWQHFGHSIRDDL